MRHIVMRATLAALAVSTSLHVFSGELVVGQIIPLSGPLTPTGTHMRGGAQLYFDVINAAGGIHGNTVKLVAKDDAYKVEETVRLTRELIRESQPIALCCILGTANVGAILKEKILEDTGTPLIAVRTGASVVVNSGNPWLFTTRASYAQEVWAIVQQYSTIGNNRFGVLYQDDGFGQDGLAAVEAALKKVEGTQLVVKSGYERNTTKVEAAVKAIAAANPQVVIMIANTAASAEFVKQSREAGNTAQFVVISTSDGPQIVAKIGAAAARGLAITQVVPDPQAKAVPLVREVQANFVQFPQKDVAVNHTFIEGYLGAKVIVEGLRRAGPNPTRKKLRDALEQIREFDVGGHYISFSPTNHNGASYVDITILDKSGRLLR